jgi:hypothetical protein
MKHNIGFRGWFYFRQGWSTYFAFIFAAINTMVVTYYLAVDNIPILKTVFPTFYIYLAITASLGIPLLILVGYAHQKKTASYKAEIDVHYESNPHALRTYNDVELNLQLNLKLIDLLVTTYEKNDSTNEELEELLKLKKEIETYIIDRRKDRRIDLKYFKKFSNMK